MKSRTAVLSVVLALGLLAAPLPSNAQQPAKVYRIGFLGVSTMGYETNPQHCPTQGNLYWQAFVEGLRERGYIRGQNLVIECRYTEWHDERAPALAAELVGLKPDLLVAFGINQVRAAKQAISTLPIVMYGVLDPVGGGLVASLAHPGGNVTGVTERVGTEIPAKRLQLLKEAVPKVSRVAALDYNSSGGPPNPANPLRREVEAAARALGVTLQWYYVREPEELEGAFPAMTTARAEALLVVEAWSFFVAHAQRIVDLAAQSRLPAAYPDRDFVKAGALLSYGMNGPDSPRRLGVYVDKILNGANPGDLPVERPTKFELLINLKAAKALGITISQSLLSRADEVIQ